MDTVTIDTEVQQKVLNFQKSEITEYHIYSSLARRDRGKNSQVLQRIADDEKRHYHEWRAYTGRDVRPAKIKVFFYLLFARIFGLTFAIKMMEQGEENAQEEYAFLTARIPAAAAILKDETEHENLLVDMIDEQKIGYISSMVLGLNDALVELTGALAGFTLALRDTRVIGMAGFITGIAAALSMAASEYLAKKSEAESKDPLRASFYTGITYLVAVLLLVFPYFVISNYYLALATTLSIAILIILVFSHFVSVVKDISFKKFFWEMVFISLGVATISFLIGWLARTVMGVDA
jgi:VIT1/CCC1 family predicted Fe2+/Mn2+ transporter